MSRREQDKSDQDTMAGTSSGGDARQYVPRPAPGYDDTSAREAGPPGLATGFTMLAAVLLMVIGVWNFLEGLAAIIKGQFFVVSPNYIYSFSTSGWGWLHFSLGIVLAAVGVSLLWDRMWARIAGVAIAALSAIASFLFIPYTPVWSIVVIAVDVFIIWALLQPRYINSAG